jgi:hypothetical protein
MALCSNGILDFGLRGALFGASLGGVVGLTKGFLGDRSKHSMDSVVKRMVNENDSLQLDADLLSAVVELGKYRKFDPAAFDSIMRGANRMVAIHAELMQGKLKVSLSCPRLISLSISTAIEGVRKLRASFAKACPGQPSELETFDESAANVQKMCTNYQHNVTMHVQSKMLET